jgi:hypothetical protein
VNGKPAWLDGRRQYIHIDPKREPVTSSTTHGLDRDMGEIYAFYEDVKGLNLGPVPSSTPCPTLSYPYP